MPAVVAADKEWGFLYAMFVFDYRLLSLPLSGEGLDIDWNAFSKSH